MPAARTPIMLDFRLSLDPGTIGEGSPIAWNERKPASKVVRVPGRDPADASSAGPDGLGLDRQSAETLSRFDRRFAGRSEGPFQALWPLPRPPSSAGVSRRRG